MGNRRTKILSSLFILSIAAFGVASRISQGTFEKELAKLSLQAQLSGIPVKTFTPQETKLGVLIQTDRVRYRTYVGGPTPFSLFSGPVIATEDMRWWVCEFSARNTVEKCTFSKKVLEKNPELAPLNTLTEFNPGNNTYVHKDSNDTIQKTPATLYEFSTEKEIIMQSGEGMEFVYQCGNAIAEGTQTYAHLNIEHTEEECDDGNDNDSDTCTRECRINDVAICGNGVVELQEECDDGNEENLDGCNVICEVETGWKCKNRLTDIQFRQQNPQSQCEAIDPLGRKDDEEDMHLECRDNQCKRVAGVGPNACAKDVDCNKECKDTDGGNAPFIKGAATLGDVAQTDYCIDDKKLNEYDCQYGFMESLRIECDNGCFEGACRQVVVDPAHLECQGLQCKKVLGAGPNTCATNDDCRGAVKTGSLFVTKDSTPLRNRQLLGGTLGEAILRVQLRAEGENIDVTDLQFSANTDVKTIDRLELFRAGNPKKFAEATIGGCGSDSTPSGTTFCAKMIDQQLVIPSGSTIDVIVRPRMKSDQQDGVSGARIVIKLEGAPVATFNEGAVRARGISSNNVLVANNGDSKADGEIFIGASVPGKNNSIIGNASYSVLSKIIKITNANPDADGTAVPTGIAPIGQFRFEAAQNDNTKNGKNDAIITYLSFNVAMSNVALNTKSLKIYNKSNPTVFAKCTPYYLTGDPYVSDNISGEFLADCDLSSASIQRKIGAGNNEIFVLEAEIVNPKISSTASSSLQISLQQFSDANIRYGSNGSHVRWEDADAVTVTQFEWIEYPETVVRSTRYES